MPCRPARAWNQLALLWIAALALLSILTSLPANAVQTITLRATRTTLLADGKQQCDLFVNIQGAGITTSADVTFTTTKGTLKQTRVRALGGVATTSLTSAPLVGYADVTAFVNGAVSNVIRIEFTDDPDATFEGNNYMLVTGAGYLAYSATDKIIEAQGQNGGAHLSFRNFELTADRLRLECNDLANIKASGNVVFKKGKDVIRGIKLNFSLASEEGQAIAEVGGKFQAVKIAGSHLHTTPDPIPTPTTRYTFPELQVKLVIVARSINYFPGDRLQFHHAMFMQDNLKILTLPNYELGLNSQELFSDQFFSVGTKGLGLDLPFYVGLSPHTSSVVDLHHGQQLGRGSFSTDPGWAVDLVKGYSMQGSQRYEGAYGFTGLLRGDWNFNWTHNQQLNSQTQASMYLDFPHHNSVYANTSLSQQNKIVRYGLNVSEGQSFESTGQNTFNNTAYLGTQPHRLFGSDSINYTLDTNYTTARLTSRDPRISAYNDTSTQIAMRAYTRPIQFGTRTTLITSVTAGQLFNGPQNTGLMGLATMSLDHTLAGGGRINMTYDFVTRPEHLIDTGGKHRMSLTYNVASNKHFSLSLFGTSYLDSPNASFLADASYRLNNDWRLLTTATFQHAETQSYNDMQFTVGRRIGARELQFTYSTFLKRLSFDLTATRF